jgi:hypothetical protein
VDTYDDAPGNRPTAAQLAANHELVIVSSTITAANVAGEFRTVNVPLVFWEQALLRTDREALADNGGTVASVTNANIISAAHPITQGLPTGSLPVFAPAAGMSVGLGNIASGAAMLATRAGSSDAAILAANQGAALLGGYIAPARRVFLFFDDTSFLSATVAAVQILDRAACWAGQLSPVITQQPVPATVAPGQAAGFTVAATGAGPLQFQWRRNGVPLTNGGNIAGATSATLIIDPATAADAGSYDVMLDGPCGPLTSAAATLTITCYANCDGSTTPPVLNVSDFSCFLNRFAAGDPYANCDGSTTPPVLNVSDFSCFLNSFATGCP